MAVSPTKILLISVPWSALDIFSSPAWVRVRRNPCRPNIQWRPCRLNCDNTDSFPAKRDSVPGGALVGGTRCGWVEVSGSFPRRCAKIRSMVSWPSMQAMTLTAPPQCPQVSMSILKTRFSRCAQVIAAWRSAGVLISAFVPVFSSLPRLAGVIHPRQLWFGARTPW